jgi:hypothetical protein
LLKCTGQWQRNRLIHKAQPLIQTSKAEEINEYECHCKITNYTNFPCTQHEKNKNQSTGSFSVYLGDSVAYLEIELTGY